MKCNFRSWLINTWQLSGQTEQNSKAKCANRVWGADFGRFRYRGQACRELNCEWCVTARCRQWALLTHMCASLPSFVAMGFIPLFITSAQFLPCHIRCARTFHTLIATTPWPFPFCFPLCSLKCFRMFLSFHNHDSNMCQKGQFKTPKTFVLNGRLLGAFAKLGKATISFMSVRPSAWNSCAPIGRMLMKFYIWAFVFGKLSRKFKFYRNPPRITGILHEDVFTFVTLFSWILRMRNVSNKSCRENQNTHFVFSNFFLKIVPFVK